MAGILSARTERYARVVAVTGSRRLAADMAGFDGPIPEGARIAATIAEERRRIMEEGLLPLALVAMADALEDKDNYRRRDEMARFVYKEYQAEQNAAGTGDNQDPADLSSAQLAKRILDLQNRAAELEGVKASKATIINGETINDIDVFG